eukprot:1194925-Prorocentrum_minimum.AAC.5
MKNPNENPNYLRLTRADLTDPSASKTPRIRRSERSPKMIFMNFSFVYTPKRIVCTTVPERLPEAKGAGPEAYAGAQSSTGRD